MIEIDRCEEQHSVIATPGLAFLSLRSPAPQEMQSLRDLFRNGECIAQGSFVEVNVWLVLLPYVRLFLMIARAFKLLIRVLDTCPPPSFHLRVSLELGASYG